MRKTRLAVTLTLAMLLLFTVSVDSATADGDCRSLCISQDSGQSFLRNTVISPPQAPDWIVTLPDDETENMGWDARGTHASDQSGETGRVSTPTAEDRIRQLEDRLKKLDLSWTEFDEAETNKKIEAAKKPTFEIGGRIHMDYWDFPDQSDGIGFFENPNPADPEFGRDPEDALAFRRIRLEFEGVVPDNMLWRMQIDFNNPSNPEIKDVYMGFDQLPGNQTLLIGNQKRPLGLDHWNSSRFNVFIERPLVVEAFNADARRPGICMSGVSDDESIIWQYGAFYLENIATDGRYLGDSRQVSVNGRLAGSPWYDISTDGQNYFHWGIAGMVAKPDSSGGPLANHDNEAQFSTRPEGRSQRRWLDTDAIAGAEWFETIALESILNLGSVQFVGEYQSTFTQRSGFGDTHFHGAYLYASYFFTGEYIPYDREKGGLERVQPKENFFLVDRHNCCHAKGWGAWNIAARYSYLDLTDKDILGGVGHAGTLALNWHWNANAKLQFDLTYGQISDHEAVGGYMGGDYTLCGTRFAIDF